MSIADVLALGKQSRVQSTLADLKVALSAQPWVTPPRDEELACQLHEVLRAQAHLDQLWMLAPTERAQPSRVIILGALMLGAKDWERDQPPPARQAIDFVAKHMNTARRNWTAGFYADPFVQTPRPRKDKP